MGNISHTVGGTSNLIQFKSAARVPITSLKCHFTPAQEGTGDPSLENVRTINGWDSCTVYTAGKNMGTIQQVLGGRPYTEVVEDGHECVYTKASGTTNVDNSSTPISFEGAFKPATQYTMTLYAKPIKSPGASSDPVSPFRIYFEYTDGTHNMINIPIEDIGNWKWYTATSTAGKSIKYLQLGAHEYRLMVYIDKNTFQLEEGATATSYESYQGQIIPITFPVLGKNKFDSKYKNIEEYTISGPYSYYYTEPIQLIPNTTYTIKPTSSGTINNWYWAVGIYNDSYNVGDSAVFTYVFNNTSYGNACTFTTGSSGIIRYLTNNKTAFAEVIQNVDIQLELGDTATTYESYDSNNTVYGGYIDLIKGELIKEWGELDLGSLTYNYNDVLTGVDRYYTTLSGYNPPSSSGNSPSIFSSIFKSENISTANTNKSLWVVGGINTTLYFYTPQGFYSNTADFKNAMSGIKLYYKLTTPIVYKIIPFQFSTLLNQNTIYSNTNGNTEVSYAIHDSTLIRMAKARIAATEPHIATATSSTITNFKTDMAIPLKSCKIYFTPTQIGSGDPSPTNIREINGWTNLVVERCGINVLQCDTFGKGTAKGITFTGVRNNDSQIEYITAVGKTTDTNIFRNLNYTADTHKLKNGDFACYSYSNNATILPCIDGNVILSKEGAGYGASSNWYTYHIDTSTGTKSWARVQITPNITDLEVDTTIYPMMCVESDKNCDYEPYKGNTYTVSWENDIGTIYGGYLDLINGEIIINYIKVHINENNIDGFTGPYENNRYRLYTTALNPLPDRIQGTNMVPKTYFISDKFSTGTSSTPNINYIAINENNRILIGVPLEYDTREKATAWLTNLGGFDLCYKILNPTTYYLSPQELKTFRGTNNIWSNANGNIEISYWTH